MLSWIFIVLAHWNNGLLIHPTRIHYPDSEPTSLCSFSLMLGDATNTNFIVFSLIRLGLEAIIYNTGGEHANHYTTNYQCSLSNNEKYFNIYIYIYIYKYLHYMYISFTKPCMTGQKVGMWLQEWKLHQT
jgi:hypothetical protein